MEKILVFADGAAKGNPGPGGWGAVVLADGTVTERGGHEAHTTNNRMELQAAIEGLRIATQKEGAIEIHTDSSYVINGITKWVHGWKKNGWRTSQGGEVLNKTLWEHLSDAVDVAARSHAVAWRHVSGHAGVAGNERVDTIASSFAEGHTPTLYSGAYSAYHIELHNLEKNESRASKKSSSGAKAYSYVSEVNGVVAVHATWRECQQRVMGKKSRFKKSLSKTDEEKIVKEFSKPAK